MYSGNKILIQKWNDHENIIMSNIVTMDTCLPAIAAVIQNDEEPIEAAKLVVELNL